MSEVSTATLSGGRGSNNAGIFRHDLTPDHQERSVFHKVLKSETVTYRDDSGSKIRVVDPELAVARYVLEGGHIPVPTPRVLAVSGRDLFYEFVPVSRVPASASSASLLLNYAARISSLGGDEALTSKGIQREAFFAAKNTEEVIRGLLDDDLIVSSIGEDSASRARDVYLKDISDTGQIPVSFSHGDLHLHNASMVDGEVFVFDWGSAGVYPVGFDLAETVTHGQLSDDFSISVPSACRQYHDRLGREDVSISHVYLGLRFAILKWLLPNHLRNIRRCHERSDQRSVSKRVDLSLSCIAVAIECAGRAKQASSPLRWVRPRW